MKIHVAVAFASLLAVATSNGSVFAQEIGATVDGLPCNALCRYWLSLGHSEQPAPPAKPVDQAAAEPARATQQPTASLPPRRTQTVALKVKAMRPAERTAAALPKKAPVTPASKPYNIAVLAPTATPAASVDRKLADAGRHLPRTLPDAPVAAPTAAVSSSPPAEPQPVAAPAPVRMASLPDRVAILPPAVPDLAPEVAFDHMLASRHRPVLAMVGRPALFHDQAPVRTAALLPNASLPASAPADLPVASPHPAQQHAAAVPAAPLD